MFYVLCAFYFRENSENKIAAIKALRAITGLGLGEAKDVVEGAELHLAKDPYCANTLQLLAESFSFQIQKMIYRRDMPATLRGPMPGQPFSS